MGKVSVAGDGVWSCGIQSGEMSSGTRPTFSFLFSLEPQFMPIVKVGLSTSINLPEISPTDGAEEISPR